MFRPSSNHLSSMSPAKNAKSKKGQTLRQAAARAALPGQSDDVDLEQEQEKYSRRAIRDASRRYENDLEIAGISKYHIDRKGRVAAYLAPARPNLDPHNSDHVSQGPFNAPGNIAMNPYGQMLRPSICHSLQSS